MDSARVAPAEAGVSEGWDIIWSILTAVAIGVVVILEVDAVAHQEELQRRTEDLEDRVASLERHPCAPEG